MRGLFLFFASIFVLACGGSMPPRAQGGGVALESADQAARAALPAETETPIPIAADDPAWGSRTALVTMVVFSDFQCPYCARGAQTVDALRAHYGPDELRVVFKH